MVMISSLENGVLCLTSSLSENYLEIPGGFEKKVSFLEINSTDKSYRSVFIVLLLEIRLYFLTSSR